MEETRVSLRCKVGSKKWLLPLPSSLTACWAGAVHRRDPEVGGASVKDDGEVLWWGADGDSAKVFHLQKRERVCGQHRGEGP